MKLEKYIQQYKLVLPKQILCPYTGNKLVASRLMQLMNRADKTVYIDCDNIYSNQKERWLISDDGYTLCYKCYKDELNTEVPGIRGMDDNDIEFILDMVEEIQNIPDFNNWDKRKLNDYQQKYLDKIDFLKKYPDVTKLHILINAFNHSYLQALKKFPELYDRFRIMKNAHIIRKFLTTLADT